MITDVWATKTSAVDYGERFTRDLEQCDGPDNDCDGIADEDFFAPWLKVATILANNAWERVRAYVRIPGGSMSAARMDSALVRGTCSH